MTLHIASEGGSLRRRKMSEAMTANKAAAVLVRPFNDQLGSWQAGSVKLHTLASRGVEPAATATQVEALLISVSDEANRFEALVSIQKPEVAGHSRIVDTRRSFRMVLDRLAAAKALLISA